MSVTCFRTSNTTRHDTICLVFYYFIFYLILSIDFFYVLFHDYIIVQKIRNFVINKTHTKISLEEEKK